MGQKSSARIIAGAAAILMMAFPTFAQQNAQTVQAAKLPKAEPKAPEALTQAVRHQLLVLPYYSVFDIIDVSVEGRKVTISGQVLRPTLKEHAEAAVISIDGVRQVVNNIEVLPSSASDDELRRELYRAIFEDSTLEKYAAQNVPAIHIIVRNQSVMLEGTVDSDGDKLLAANRANSITNVTGVRNNLIVQKRNSSGN